MNNQHKQTSSSLKVAVIGIGSIGSAFAFQLSRAGGHDLTAVARPASLRFEQLMRDGAIVNTAGQRAEVQVTDQLNEQIPYDLVLVTLLAHQVQAVLSALQRSAAKAILFMFNNFEPEMLRDALGAERCCFGMPFIQAHLARNGRLTAKIGAGGQKSKIDCSRWVDVFNAAGLPAVVEADMLLWLRCQVPLGAAFESVCVAAMRRGRGASWEESMVIARGAQEGFTLIQKLGYRVYPSGKAFLHASPAWVLAGVLWSMSKIPSFRELLATGLNECCALVDVLIASASRVDSSVAVNRIAAMKPKLMGTEFPLSMPH